VKVTPLLSGTVVALAVIGTATAAVMNGSIDAAAFSAIIGAAIGVVSGASGTIVNDQLNGRRKDASEGKQTPHL
jgi:hypothetical protein